MTGLLADAASWLFIVLGGLFVLIGGIGILRLPEFFSRLHAASVTDTLGAGLILLGLAVQAGFSLTTIKLALVYGFFLLTSPTASHALAKAALHGGLSPRADREPPA